MGKLRPLKLYAVPVTLADEMVISDVPVFVSLDESTLALPTMTLPNQRFPLELRDPLLP